MINFIIIISIIIIFFLTKVGVYYITDINRLVFLNYKPFSCYLCCGFWTLLTEYLTLGFCFNKLFFTGIIITILDAIAQIIDRKNKTKFVN